MADRRPLSRRFYARDPAAVARDVLGRLVVREIDGELLVGRIVEAEAYATDDPASHSYRGETRRNATMFGPPGHAYVYVSHGVHHCLNVTTGRGNAVLLRALEPLEGIDRMTAQRGVADPRLLCSGPGRLCQALGVGLADDGVDLTAGEGLWIARGLRASEVAVTPRVGIRLAADVPWRFVVAGSRYLSRPAAVRSRRRG